MFVSAAAGVTCQADVVVDDLLVAHNPDPDSSLPYLVRIPLGPSGIVVKARETWPKASKVYCHRADGWPGDAEIVERHPVRSCTRRGPAIHLVLDPGPAKSVTARAHPGARPRGHLLLSHLRVLTEQLDCRGAPLPHVLDAPGQTRAEVRR